MVTDERFMVEVETANRLEAMGDPISLILAGLARDSLRQHLAFMVGDKDQTEEERQAGIARAKVLEPLLPRGYQRIPHV